MSPSEQYAVAQHAEVQSYRLDVAFESRTTNTTRITVDVHIVSTVHAPRLHPFQEIGQEFRIFVHCEPMLLPVEALGQVTDIRPGARCEVEGVQRLISRQGRSYVQGQRLGSCRDVRGLAEPQPVSEGINHASGSSAALICSAA